MAVYFLDSSAIVKRYVQETGTAWIATLCDPAAGEEIYAARIAGVEVAAAISRRVRTGGLAPSDAALMHARFRMEFFTSFHQVEITEPLILRAMSLIEAHRLRGYDAVQLAAALEVNTDVLALGLPSLTLVSADTELNSAAAAEGLTVIDPGTLP